MTIPQPTAFYRFESNGNDSSGNSRHLDTASGTPSYSAGVNGNGITGGVLYTENPAYREQFNIWEGDFTVAWFSKTEGGDGYPEQEWQVGPFRWASKIRLEIASEYVVLEEWEQTRMFEFTLSGGPVLAVNGWHHVVFTQAGNTLKLYVDGTLRGTQTRTPLVVHKDVIRLSVGAKTDNLYIFNGTALDASQIAELYNAGAGYEYSPPVQRSPDEFYYLMF